MTVVAALVAVRVERLVAADRAHLHREHRRRQAAQHQLAHRRQRLPPALKQHEVLELVEVRLVDHRIDHVRGGGSRHGDVAGRSRGCRRIDLVVDLHVAEKDLRATRRGATRARRARPSPRTASRRTSSGGAPAAMSSNPSHASSQLPVIDALARGGRPERPRARGSVMTPSIPTETCAARRSSAASSAISTTAPDAVTRRHPANRGREAAGASGLNRASPVETAPAICWATMSPWFASARPAAHSGSPNSPIVVAGPTTDPAALRVDRADASGEGAHVASSKPVREDDGRERMAGTCPDAQTAEAIEQTSSATSSSLLGAASSAGAHV